MPAPPSAAAMSTRSPTWWRRFDYGTRRSAISVPRSTTNSSRTERRIHQTGVHEPGSNSTGASSHGSHHSRVQTYGPRRDTIRPAAQITNAPTANSAQLRMMLRAEDSLAVGSSRVAASVARAVGSPTTTKGPTITISQKANDSGPRGNAVQFVPETSAVKDAVRTAQAIHARDAPLRLWMATTSAA